LAQSEIPEAIAGRTEAVEGCGASVVRRLDGSGTTWFDDLEVSLLSGSHAAKG